MKVIIDTEKLRTENEVNQRDLRVGESWMAGSYVGYRLCCDKVEQIGTPVAEIVEQLRVAMKSYGWDEDCDVLSVGKIIGSEECCDRLKRILEVKP